ncbi:hypothetical protein FD07_GL002155 [Levilactobacillus parabrevis ATCC 53295]|uniref:Uncharacterized protein n=1 Tax=Levilactobacillus parabrevis ATCC 53295 TaxID=1267003 RepID=A0A0R1GGH7_9LACO|nr:hypothetical protein FD07_GL002155 [Levilactobacillus parabrevis ATCC 53295]
MASPNADNDKASASDSSDKKTADKSTTSKSGAAANPSTGNDADSGQNSQNDGNNLTLWGSILAAIAAVTGGSWWYFGGKRGKHGDN